MQILFLLLVIIVFMGMGYAFSVLRSLGGWNRAYTRLGKRYAGKPGAGGVFYGYLLSNPSLAFDYGRTFCHVRNRRSKKFPGGRHTELSMKWPGYQLRLEISTLAQPARTWGAKLKQVELDDPQFQTDFYIASNQPEVAKRLLTGSVQWQLEQLRRHTTIQHMALSLNRGVLSICNPGYIKDYQQLDDFIRFGLEVFDQMMLVGAEGIEFLKENEASIVSDVKCPICSEEIMHDLVVCQRCKTPHCMDCWEYNGQCATFSCGETRFVKTGSLNV